MDIQVSLASGETRSIPLGQEGLVVGSSAGCDVVLTISGVSSRHAFFQIDPSGATTVQEMGTASPVTVNGVRITEAVALKASDEVQVADATFKLVPGAASESAVAVTTAAAATPAAATSAAMTPAVASAATPEAATAGAGTEASKSKNPMMLAIAGVAALLVVVLVVVLVTSGGEEESPAPVAEPLSVIPSPLSTLTEEPSPTSIPTEAPVKAQPVSKARIDGPYNGKYGFVFKPNCKSGPCGGIAQSGAQFTIPYNCNSSYRGHSSLRDTCADGGVHVQAPLKVDLAFRPTDAVLVGDKWIATKVDMTLTVSRNAFSKKVRTSPTIITTLTCDAYKKTDRWVAVRAT